MFKRIKSGLLRDQRGFSLLEVLVAVSILAFIGVAVVQGLTTVSRSTAITDEKSVAGNLATGYIDSIKGLDYAATYPTAGQNITIPSQYSVVVDITFSSNGTTWSYVYTGQTLQKIRILISRESRPVLSVCTFRTER